MLENAHTTWRVEPFRRHTRLATETRAGRAIPLLSLASTGAISPRTEDGGLGRQAPATNTIKRCWVVRRGDLVVNPMWLIGGGIGVSAVVGAVSPDYRVYHLSSDLYPGYLHHLLRSQPYLEQYKLYARAETTFDRRVSKADFHAMPILVPPMQNQRRISDFLDTEIGQLDRLLGIRKRQLECLNERRFTIVRETLMQGMNSEGLQSTGMSWLPTCPSGWKLTPLRYLTECLDGRRIPLSSEQRSRQTGEYPYYGASGIVDGVDSYLFDEPLVLLGEDGAQLGNQNLPIAAYVQGKIWVNNHAHVLRPAGIDGSLLAEILNVFDRNLCMSGSTREKITQDAMKAIRIPVPPVDEQYKLMNDLASRLQKQQFLAQWLGRQVSLLAERKQALITAAVTGEIDVTTARGVEAS